MSTELNELTKLMPGGKVGAVWLTVPTKSDTQSTSKAPCISFFTAVQLKSSVVVTYCSFFASMFFFFLFVKKFWTGFVLLKTCEHDRNQSVFCMTHLVSMFPSCQHYISSAPLQTDVHTFLWSHWHSPALMSHTHAHKQECSPPHSSQHIIIVRTWCTNIKSFAVVSPQWQTRAPMPYLVSAAWPTEPNGAGVSVLGCSWSRATATARQLLWWWRRVVRGPRALEAGAGACPVPATRRWTNWIFTTTKPCRTAAVSVSFCPTMTRSMS